MVKGREENRREWGREVAAWRASGKSLSRWARERGLSRDALEYWKRRLGAAAGPAPLKLIAVTPAGGERLPAIDVILEGKGVRLVLPAGCEMEAICRLVRAVGV